MKTLLEIRDSRNIAVTTGNNTYGCRVLVDLIENDLKQKFLREQHISNNCDYYDSFDIQITNEVADNFLNKNQQQKGGYLQYFK